MKKIISLLAALCVIVSFAVPASAAGFAVSLSPSKNDVSAGDTVTFTVSLGGAGRGTSGYIEVAASSNFELISGKFLTANTQMADFDKSTSDGTVMYNGESNPNGAFCEFVLKAKTASKTAQNVSVTVDIRNGSALLGSVKASKDIKIMCASHTFGNYTNVNASTHKRVCSVCGYEETKNHTWDGGTVTKQASCKESGTKHFTCTACGDAKDETIAKTNSHSWGGYKVTQNPGCTTPGTQTRTCSVCGKSETQPINATGHSMGAWSQSKAPTCTAAGEEKRSCSKCGHTETKAINALGHSFSNPTVTKSPTCTETGVESGKCTRCGQTTTNTIKAKGHKFGAWEDTKPATCTEGGIKERKCADCGASETKATEALGHDFENPTIVKAATISETGLKEGKCRRCGETASEVIPCTAQDEATGTLFEASEGVFAAGTQLSVEEIKTDNPTFDSAKNILKDICNEFKLYNIKALLDGAEVTLGGEITATFNIPEGYGRDIALYIIKADGTSERLDCNISEDGKTLSAKLTALGDYAICKLGGGDKSAVEGTPADKAEKAESNTALYIIITAAAVIVIGGGTAAFIIIKKKRQ